MKTLADFKQEVAQKYGYKCFDHHNFDAEKIHDLAAELYAEYKAKEAYEKGVNEAVGKAVSEMKDEGYKEGWNDALHWAAKEAKVYSKLPYEVNPQSILKGLKP